MKCQYCDTELFESETVCPRCGMAVEENQPTVEIINEAPKKDKGKIFGIISLALSIISIVFGTLFGYCCNCYSLIFNFIPTIIAIAGIALGVISVILSKKSGNKNILGTVGVILSIISIVSMIILFVFSIILAILSTVMELTGFFGLA